jgi:hypothetical protein
MILVATVLGGITNLQSLTFKSNFVTKVLLQKCSRLLRRKMGEIIGKFANLKKISYCKNLFFSVDKFVEL